MPEGIITGAQNASAVAIVVAAKALAPLKSETIAWAVATMDYQKDVSTFGSQVNVPIPAEFSTNLIADGGTVTRQNPSLGTANIILNKHRELTWEHTDINKALATPNLEGLSLGQAIANYAEAMDSDLLGIYLQFTVITDVGAFNTAITEGVVDAAETALFDQRVPGGATKSLILTGDGYSNVRQIPRFTEADKRAGADAANAKLMGKIKGFNVYRAQQTNVTNSGADRHGIAMGPAGLLGAVRQLGTEQMGMGVVQVEVSEDNVGLRLTMSYQHEVLGRMTTIDSLYGFIAGRTNHGVEVRH